MASVTLVSLSELCHKLLVTSTAVNSSNQPIIVIDAGHGGQDSGTKGICGTYEKDLNLSISFKIEKILKAIGYEVIMTRKSDALIGDNSLSTIRERKRSDLNNRLNIISIENSYLVSIHQNYYKEPKYNGTQVFYSTKNEQSKIIAKYIQSKVVDILQKDNDRAIKPTGSEIYLLDKTLNPAVMVECGFMSNVEELNLLKDEEYQYKMALCIALGLNNYFCSLN